MQEMMIDKRWQTWAHACMPKEAGQTQITECRRAFYAGATALFTTLWAVLDPGSEPTDADLQKLDQIEEELKDFSNAVLAGKA